MAGVMIWTCQTLMVMPANELRQTVLVRDSDAPASFALPGVALPPSLFPSTELLHEPIFSPRYVWITVLRRFIFQRLITI